MKELCPTKTLSDKTVILKSVTLIGVVGVLYDAWYETPIRINPKVAEDLKQLKKILKKDEVHLSLPRSTFYSLSNKKQINNATNRVRCRPVIPSEEEFAAAGRLYGVSKKATSSICTPLGNYQKIHQLCTFVETNGTRLDHIIQCNVKPCGGSSIKIGLFNQQSGFITYHRGSTPALKTKVELENAVTELNRKTTDVINFCILICFNNPYFIKQALVFPPRMNKIEKMRRREHINVNIVVLDSVSRQHFYRQLPSSVNTLKNVKSAGQSLVFDYELFQSIAPRTFPNMRALFSGKVDIDSDDESHTYDLSNLTSHFKELGYQSLIQEDSCWYDVWGSLLTDNKHLVNIAHNWSAVHNKIKQLPFDDYGVSHLSCEVFQQYGKTNQFNDPPKVCYNGHVLSEYFLNYTYQYVYNIEKQGDSKPGFLYTHLNTAHEATGKRISQMDNLLADFITKVEKLDNTITILMSDHGPKTTKFAQDYLAGRLEIGHAFMFLLIPNKVKLALGLAKIRSLDTNQNILFSALDLYKTFKTLHRDVTGDGLLRPLPEDRYCSDVPIYSFMNCLCDGDTNMVVQVDSIHWIAEFAVGYLNQQITQSIISSGRKNGYGNCERLIGSQFNKIRLKNVEAESYVQYTIDILVHKYRGEEIFEVVVRRLHQQQKGRIQVIKWRRVSIYQHFSKCCDKPVDIQLCVCRKESRNIDNPGRDLARLLSTPNFGVKTDSAFLDSKCLLLTKREKINLFRTYEITNMCIDRFYVTNFTIDSTSLQSAVRIPIYTTVKAWFIYYITTISLAGGNHGNPQENISFKMENV